MNKWKRSDVSDREVCLACRRRSTHEFITDELAKRFPGCPPKVLYAALERACRRGLIEYGVSMRTGWLTPEGEELAR